MPYTLKKMHGSLYNHNLWHKTGSNQELDSGKAWSGPPPLDRISVPPPLPTTEYDACVKVAVGSILISMMKKAQVVPCRQRPDGRNCMQ